MTAPWLKVIQLFQTTAWVCFPAPTTPAPNCPQPHFQSVQCLLLTSRSTDMLVEKWKEEPQRPSTEVQHIWIQTQNTWF